MCDQPCLAPTWDEGKHVLFFPSNGTYARGLTNTLAADFMPNFSPSVAISATIPRPRKHGRSQGRSQGNLADKDMSLWANSGVRPPIGKDPRFDRICDVIKSKRWIPIAAQFPVGCEDLRLATKIDLIVLDAFSRLILIELKCGFDDYFDVHNQGNMKYPFEHVPMSYRNKAYLQLAMTTYLFLHCQHRLSHYKYHGSYLLHIYDDGGQPDGSRLQHSLTPLPRWTYASRETVQQCIEVLRQSKKRNKKECKRVVSNGYKRARYAAKK